MLVETQLEAFKRFFFYLHYIGYTSLGTYEFPASVPLVLCLSTWRTHDVVFLSAPCHFLVDGYHQDDLPGGADGLISRQWLWQVCM